MTNCVAIRTCSFIIPSKDDTMIVNFLGTNASLNNDQKNLYDIYDDKSVYISFEEQNKTKQY